MSEPTAEPVPAENQRNAGNPAVTWTIRFVVFGVLAALLIVAFLQFRVKRSFEASQDAIMDKFDDAGAMVLKDAEDLMEGDPDVSKGKGDDVFNVNVYTWSGPIPWIDYTLRIKYSKLSKNIQRVSGKADEEEAAEE
ncbi:MAG: hypothetical protein ACE5KM_06415 [Planctomycetaceae bacterium]